ncbi:MAG: hypothetical protein JSR51_09020 [Proteobacteria bacterium]|nr:hypothetical protein [Pseudomonadota bacterium]
MSDNLKKKVAPPNPAKEPLTKGHHAKVDMAAKAAVNYQVAVHTGDIPYAGTDGDVWLWVDGTAGRSGWRYLDTAIDNFERGSTDYFYLTLPDLGWLSAAWIYFRPRGSNAGWFLDTVVVNGRTFSYYRWLENEGLVRLTTT